jgi:hypothetical protein
MNFAFHKRLGISLLAEWLSASQKGLCAWSYLFIIPALGIWRKVDVISSQNLLRGCKLIFSCNYKVANWVFIQWGRVLSRADEIDGLGLELVTNIVKTACVTSVCFGIIICVYTLKPLTNNILACTWTRTSCTLNCGNNWSQARLWRLHPADLLKVPTNSRQR